MTQNFISFLKVAIEKYSMKNTQIDTLGSLFLCAACAYWSHRLHELIFGIIELNTNPPSYTSLI